MKAISEASPIPSGRKDTILLRLEACENDAGESWQLSQMNGPTLLSDPMFFPARSDAVEYAKQQCGNLGCDFVIRSAKRDRTMEEAAP